MIHDGVIYEKGTFDELLEMKGEFYKLQAGKE